MSDPDSGDVRTEEAADRLLAELGEAPEEASAAGPDGGGRIAPGIAAEGARESLHD